MKHGFLGVELKNKNLKIAGAGISGLSLGFFLVKNNFDIQILEAAKRSGGLIQSVKLKDGLSEAAANSFIPCPAIDEITDELNLQLLSPNKASSRRYLVKDGKLTTFPFSFSEALSLPFKFFQKRNWDGGSIADLGYTFFGKNITHNVIEPALAGIYAADIRLLDVEAMFPDFNHYLKEKQRLYPAIKQSRKHLSKSKNQKAKGTYSFSGGMEEMTNGLSAYLNSFIQYQSPLTKLPENDDLIITSPAYKTAELFDGHPISALLNEIFYTPVISVTLFFEKKAFENFKPGFGCLIPRHEGFHSLGYIFSSLLFDNRVEDEQMLSMTAILRDGDPENPAYGFMDKSDEDIVSDISADLKKLFSLKSEPVAFKVWRWEKGIPLYDKTFRKNCQEIHRLLQQDFPHIRLFGNYTGNISIRGICTAAKALAEKSD